jgi:hypothetical protein
MITFLSCPVSVLVNNIKALKCTTLVTVDASGSQVIIMPVPMYMYVNRLPGLG